METLNEGKTYHPNNFLLADRWAYNEGPQCNRFFVIRYLAYFKAKICDLEVKRGEIQDCNGERDMRIDNFTVGIQEMHKRTNIRKGQWRKFTEKIQDQEQSTS